MSSPSSAAASASAGGGVTFVLSKKIQNTNMVGIFYADALFRAAANFQAVQINDNSIIVRVKPCKVFTANHLFTLTCEDGCDGVEKR